MLLIQVNIYNLCIHNDIFGQQQLKDIDIDIDTETKGHGKDTEIVNSHAVISYKPMTSIFQPNRHHPPIDQRPTPLF